MRVVAMIPARLGSKRIKRKNLRLLGNKPLLQWVIDTARGSDLFDGWVYVNSEASEIGVLCERLGVPFYRRPPHLATDTATNDDFMRDFIQKVAQPGGFTHVAQINPTSPFLTDDDMRRALKLADEGATTVISVRRLQAECRAYMRPINYDPQRHMPPSQDLAPIHYFCNGIFVWEVETFLRAYYEYKGAAVYGPLGVTEYVELSGDSAIDLDTEEDWQAAEAIVRRRSEPAMKARYWAPTLEQECDAMRCLADDGIRYRGSSMSAWGGWLIAYLKDSLQNESVVPRGSASSWRIVSTPSTVATVISQMPGDGNRLHYHPDCDEWWLVVEGQFDFYMDGDKERVSEGSIVVVPRGVWHQITAVGDKRAVRLAVSKEGAAHVYHD